MTPEQALHQAIQNDWQLNFLRSGLKCHLETQEIKYLLTGDSAHRMTDPKTDDYQRLIQQRIDELTRHYLL